MSRSIDVAALQLRARDRRDFACSLDSTMSAVRRAASTADLLVLPEATFPAYVLGGEPVDEGVMNDVLDRLGAIAADARCVIVTGAVAPAGTMAYNSAFVFDADGSIAGRVDKLFLWHFDRRWFLPGERLAPVQTSVAMLGVLICADGRLPTIARTLVDRGAQLLVMPTAWVTSGREPRSLENVQADLLASVRAYENRVPFIAANKCGAELSMVAYCGKSQIVNRDGEIIALAGEDREETLRASLQLGAVRPPRAAPERPTPRALRHRDPTRIAISFDPLCADIDERLEVLDADYALSAEDAGRLALLDRAIPTAAVDDACVLDPAGLVAYREAGYMLICWTTKVPEPWTQRLARARALELRIHLVVFGCCARRAFAVDPDGTIIAGTFGDYRLASFLLDPHKAEQTAVAPSTDVTEGLARVARIAIQKKATQ